MPNRGGQLQCKGYTGTLIATCDFLLTFLRVWNWFYRWSAYKLCKQLQIFFRLSKNLDLLPHPLKSGTLLSIIWYLPMFWSAKWASYNCIAFSLILELHIILYSYKGGVPDIHKCARKQYMSRQPSFLYGQIYPNYTTHPLAHRHSNNRDGSTCFLMNPH